MRLSLLALVLAGTGSLQAQAAPSRLQFHHLSIVLDSATAHDVAASPFVAAQFAGQVDRSSDVGAIRCSGNCLVGRHTYLELFSPSEPPGSRSGDVSLVLASEQAGGLMALWQRETSRATVDTMTWLSNGSGYPAFLRWRVEGAESADHRLTLAVVEYTLDAARRAAVVDSLAESDRRRDRFLAPYRNRDQLLGELTAATLSAPTEEIARICRTLDGFGVTVISEGQGAVIQLPGFTLRLLPGYDRLAVRKLEFSLTREALANPTYRFGPSSRLRFGPGRVAVWEF